MPKSIRMDEGGRILARSAELSFESEGRARARGSSRIGMAQRVQIIIELFGEADSLGSSVAP